MPFDGLAIRAISEELNKELLNARIDKIYQPERDELLLSLRHVKDGNNRLVISANARWARIHLTDQRKENPSQPPSFCMLLRKYLEGGKIKAVKQVDFERIVHIHIEALDDFREWKEKILICEFMGRHSNIILINPETGIIIDAIKRFGNDVSTYREVLPGKEYKAPPSQGKNNPLHTEFDGFYTAMWAQDGKTMASAVLSVYSGISPFSARELCFSCGLDPDVPVEQCGEFELSKLYHYVQDLLSNIDLGNIHPAVLYENNEPIDFCPYPPQTRSSQKFVETEQMNDCCDRFHQEKLGKIRLDNLKLTLSRKIQEYLDKSYKRQQLQEQDLRKAHENEKYRIWGELLTAYAHCYKKGDLEAELKDFYTNDLIKLPLSPRYTPIENAQKFFKLYNKSRGAQKHLTQRLQESCDEIDYLESVLVAIRGSESSDDLAEIAEELMKEGYSLTRSTKAKAKEKQLRRQPRRFLSSDGLEILVGRNNRQNDWLTLRQSDREDLWLHTKEIPGTHVIVSLPKTCHSIDEVPDQTIEEAAGLAAYYSKASESEKVPVDYTFRYNVKKPSGAKPGMVIYDNYWTVMINPRSQTVQSLLDQKMDE